MQEVLYTTQMGPAIAYHPLFDLLEKCPKPATILVERIISQAFPQTEV